LKVGSELAAYHKETVENPGNKNTLLLLDLKELYGMEASPTLISNITNKVLPQVREWQNRPLADIYTIVFLDAIHYKVRQDGAIYGVPHIQYNRRVKIRWFFVPEVMPYDGLLTGCPGSLPLL
jgi:hypothetical protein